MVIAVSSQVFSLPIVPRYAEVDQQGVVFNGHYLTWFDEAATAFFDHVGLPFDAFLALDLDVQVVHTEIDFATPVRWRDGVRVAVASERIGTTSFTLRFDVLRRAGDEDERVAVQGRTVYVVVSSTDWTKRELPPELRDALISVAAQGLPPEGTV